MKKDKEQSKAVIMTVDMGGSKTKIVVQEVGSNEPSLLLMDSSLADIGKASLDLAPTEGRSSDRAWVGYKGEGEEYLYYAVGALARNTFGGFSQLHKLKYEIALPKILAAIWLARVELELPAKFHLCMSVLLPAGEMGDKALLKKSLVNAIQSFETPDGKMAVKLRHCEISSEGSGIYQHRKNVLGNEFDDRRQLYVMLGYRNASVFLVRSGVLQLGVTSDFGMHWMLDLVSPRISGFDKNNPNVTEIIVNSGHSPEVLKKLSRKRRQQDIELDYESITNAIAYAKKEYVRAVVRWLQSIIGEFDEVVMCGGTAEYLRGELDKYYSNGTGIVWHGGVVVPSEYESKLGSSRLADVWALHEVFYKLVAARIDGVVSKPDNDVSKGDDDTSKNFVLKPRRVERPAGTLPPIVS